MVVPHNSFFGSVRSTFEVIPPFDIFYILQFAPRDNTFYISSKYFVRAMTCHPQCRKSKIRLDHDSVLRAIVFNFNVYPT